MSSNNALSPVGGKGSEKFIPTRSVFCTPSPGGRQCKDDRHTNACRAREALSRNLLDWLRDEAARKQRAQIARDWGELSIMDLFSGFAVWYAQRQMSLWQATDAVTHMAISRGVQDLGSFATALEVATDIYQDEALRRFSRQDSIEHDERGPEDIVGPRASTERLVKEASR